MRPEIHVIQRLPDAIRGRKWGVSATMSHGFSPLHFLVGDLYGGSMNLSYDEYELHKTVCADGLAYLGHLNPPLILVKKTNEAQEITKLARQLVRVADQNQLEDLVLDHYRMLGFSKYVNPALALPMLQGAETTPTVSLQRIYIFADPNTYGGKNHLRDWQRILQDSNSNYSNR